jgi:hypothetical protein
MKVHLRYIVGRQFIIGVAKLPGTVDEMVQGSGPGGTSVTIICGKGRYFRCPARTD